MCSKRIPAFCKVRMAALSTAAGYLTARRRCRSSRVLPRCSRARRPGSSRRARSPRQRRSLQISRMLECRLHKMHPQIPVCQRTLQSAAVRPATTHFDFVACLILHANFVSGRRSVYAARRALVSGQLRRLLGEVHSRCRGARHASGRPLFQERHERTCSVWHQAGCGGAPCSAGRATSAM